MQIGTFGQCGLQSIYIFFKRRERFAVDRQVKHSRRIARSDACGNSYWFGHVHPSDVLGPVPSPVLRQHQGSLLIPPQTREGGKIIADVAERSPPRNRLAWSNCRLLGMIFRLDGPWLAFGR